MSTDGDRVIVQAGATSQAIRLYHRDFAEIRAEGENLEAAKANLVNHLTRALDSALTNWRRDAILKAIDEVSEFEGTA